MYYIPEHVIMNALLTVGCTKPDLVYPTHSRRLSGKAGKWNCIICLVYKEYVIVSVCVQLKLSSTYFVCCVAIRALELSLFEYLRFRQLEAMLCSLAQSIITVCGLLIAS